MGKAPAPGGPGPGREVHASIVKEPSTRGSPPFPAPRGTFPGRRETGLARLPGAAGCGDFQRPVFPSHGTRRAPRRPATFRKLREPPAPRRKPRRVPGDLRRLGEGPAGRAGLPRGAARLHAPLPSSPRCRKATQGPGIFSSKIRRFQRRRRSASGAVKAIKMLEPSATRRSAPQAAGDFHGAPEISTRRGNLLRSAGKLHEPMPWYRRPQNFSFH